MRRVLRIVIFAALTVVLAVAMGGYVVYRDWTQGPLPKHDGEITIPGLEATVEIYRDEWGVPHIYASSTHDLAFAQGYAQAQDRWWQMEFFRHTASGRIQELTGKTNDLIGTDVFLRTLGFREVAAKEFEHYDDGTQAILQAFADGVNAYIQTRSNGDLAFEYNVLALNGVDIDVEPWTPIDTIIWGKLMSLNLGANYDNEELFSDLYKEIGEELVNTWYPDYPYETKSTIVQADDMPGMEETSVQNASTEIVQGIRGINTQFAGGFDMAQTPLPFGHGIGIGSNNWVVDGSMTQSGKPLMANDMHLGIQMPSIWYEVGLHCQPVSEACPYNVVGFAFAPSPMVIAGHNDNIAWALTNVSPDTQDLYQIRINPQNPLEYEWNGEWRALTVRDESIRYGDGTEPVKFQVRMTHLGPILNDNQRDDAYNLQGFNNVDPLALHWTALEPGTLFEAVIRLNRAADWNDFTDALSYWDSPSQNVIYADLDGNIGYQTPGRIPIRTEDHTGTLPVPGWTDEYEWRGFIPYDYLPRIFNPARGYVSSANQALVPQAYYDWLSSELHGQYDQDSNYTISTQWAFGYRGDRVNQLIETLAPHSAATFQQMHADNYDGSAAEIVPLLAEVSFQSPEISALRDWLLNWDYRFDMDNPYAAYYGVFWKYLVQNTYNDQFGELYEASGSDNERWSVYLLMQQPDHAWWDDVTTTEMQENRDEILERSMAAAQKELIETQGDDRAKWRWGNLHTTLFVSNPLGASGIGILESIVNRGPVQTAGTGSAINATAWSANSEGFEVRSGPSERVIYDLSDWSKSLSMHTTGQSGHPFSGNYDTMIDPWRTIEYHPMLWTRAQVEAASRNKLRLLPTN